jgi:Carboxypeptidase regulatory-like domain
MRRYGFRVRSLVVCLAALVLYCGDVILAQDRSDGEAGLRVAVVDPNGAAITGARVRVTSVGSALQVLETNMQGEAVFQRLHAGRAQLQVEAAGFEPRTLDDTVLRAGSNQLQVELEIAKIKEDVAVATDEREKNTDPNGPAFSNVLTNEQLAALPDDADEFENAINQLAGPGATIRVNGFHGGKLPPKSQIQEIRFRRNTYAAENHERALMSVDITTRPGINDWHGTASFGFRDEALSARPAFAPRRGPEQQRRTGLTLDGPLWKNHTSLFLFADSALSYDSKTIVAALPDGSFNDIALRPTRRLNLSARIEHALNKTHSLRFEYQRNAGKQDNLGVGDFDLIERAYALEQAEHIFRLAESGVIYKQFLNEFRFQARWQDRDTLPAINAPTIQVLNAFNRGGAQTLGSRRAREFELADNFDLSAGAHSMRMGLLFEAGSYRSDETINANGVFTFADLEAFRAGRPTTYSQRTGDPFISYSQYKFSWYWQDDFRLRKNLMLSYGLRQEFQSNVRDRNNFAPRIGISWTPNKSGTVTIRAGAGIFYDWFGEDTYEQTLRVNGLRQRDLVVLSPGFPDPFQGGNEVALPPGRIQSDPLMRQPMIAQASVGVEARLFNRVRFGTDYQFQRGTHLLRSRNLNAPVPGRGRPDPTAGNILQVESSASSNTHRLMFFFAPASHKADTFWSAFYAYSHTTNEGDGPLSLPADNFNLRNERGPSPSDFRHYFSAFLSRRLSKGFTLGVTFNAASALPYNITTGFDDNGDSISNDRPRGVRRNSALGAARWDWGTRLGWGFGFGGARQEQSQVPVMIRIGGGNGEGGGIPSLPGANDKRFRLDFYAQAYNLFNHTNPVNFSGVQTSPFFGQPTATLPGRRIETGMRLSF